MTSTIMDDTSFLLTNLLSTLEFAVEIPKHLVCDRCDQAAIRPWRAKCKHLFCCRCLNEIMRGLQKCPLDGQSTILGEIFLEKDTDNAVRKLLVRCLYLKQGCGHIVVLGKLMDHIHVCDYLPVYCPKNCGLTVSRKDVVQHLITSCPKIHCPQDTHIYNASKSIKRWSSIRNMVGSTTSLDYNSDTLINKSSDAKIMEMTCEFQQLNSNVNKLLKEIKTCTDRSIAPYDANVVKKSCSVSDLIRDVSLKSKYHGVGEHGNKPLPLALNLTSDNEIEETSPSFIDKILNRLQILTKRIQDLDTKIATNERVNSSAASMLEKMNTIQTSLHSHYKKLGSLESSQDKLQTSLHEMMKYITKNGDSLDVAIKYLEDFNKKMDMQNDIWLNMIGNAREPWHEDSGQGQLIWKISQYNQRKQRAVIGQEAEIYSPSFFSHHYGYKLCLRAYLNGYMDGAGTHFSIYVCLMKGPFDNTLSWPFKGKFTFFILDQINRDKKEHFVLNVDPKKMGNFIKWCQKPESERNVGFGLPEFIPHKVLENRENGYLINDTIYVKIAVDGVKDAGHRSAK